MKIKRSRQTKYLLTTALLICGLVFNALPTSAATSKIIVDDKDSDGKISIGDAFCIGSECFNVVKNENGNIRALAKYNLYVGSNYNKVVLDINKIYIKTAVESNGASGESTYFFENEQLSNEEAWRMKIVEKYNIEIGPEEYPYFNGETIIKGTEYEENGTTYINSTLKFYPDEKITTSTNGYALQNPLARGVTGEKGNANYPIYATVKFDPFSSINPREIYKKGYVNVNLKENAKESQYLTDYQSKLENIGDYKVSNVDLLNITDIDNLVYSIKGSKLPLTEWYNQALNQEPQQDEIGKYSQLGSIKSILSDDYSWLWNTSYWLMTLSDDAENIADVSYYQNATMYFISTAGDICYTDSCNTAIPRAGIRPVITMKTEDFELNSFDINGTVRWIDNNNASNIRPDKSIIKLYRNGKFVASVHVTKGNDDNLWLFSFKNLPKYDENGKEYIYTITQDDVPMYASSVNSFDVVNRYAPNPKTADNAGLWPSLLGGSAALIAAAISIGRKRR